MIRNVYIFECGLLQMVGAVIKLVPYKFHYMATTSTHRERERERRNQEIVSKLLKFKIMKSDQVHSEESSNIIIIIIYHKIHPKPKWLNLNCF